MSKKKTQAKKKIRTVKKTVKKIAAKRKPVKTVKAPAQKKAVKKAIVKAAPPKKAATVRRPQPKKSVKAAPQPKAAVKPQIKAPVKARVQARIDAMQARRPQSDVKPSYKVGCYVVYPTHGVGKITAQETQEIGDVELKMLVISFEKDKMTLRVPMHRAGAAGLRPVSTSDEMKRVFVTLKARARTSRGMWSRRAQEYEAKINSGNVIAVAEVVRDLHQNVDQSERSYSERMIYESALGRLVGELAAAEGTNHEAATDRLMKLLRGKVAAAAAAAAKAA